MSALLGTLRQVVGLSKNEAAIPADRQQSPQEVARVNEIVSNVRMAWAARQDVVSIWQQAARYYDGDHWSGKKVPKNAPKPVPINFAFLLVESLVPHMATNLPVPTIWARKDMYQQLSDVLEKLVQYLFDANDISTKVAEAERIRLKLGTSIWKVFFDPMALDGIGDVAIEIVDPANFGVDQGATSLRDAEWCFTAVPKSLAYIRKRYPEKGPLVQAEAAFSDTEVYSQLGEQLDARAGRALLIEYWYKDQDGDIGVATVANMILLADRPKIYRRQRRFPFVRMTDYPRQKSFWGIGEVEPILKGQDIVNKLMQIILQNASMGVGQWVVDAKRAGITDLQAFADRASTAGLVIPVNDLNAVKKESGVQLPPWLMALVDTLIKYLQDQMGLYDAYRGLTPGSVTAASAIFALQQAAGARPDLKRAALANGLREVVELILGYVLDPELYAEPRSFMTVGSNNQPEYHTLDLQEWQALAEAQGTTFAPEFDVRMAIGFSGPLTAQYAEEQALKYFQQGVIADPIDVLEVSSLPNKDAIIRRFQEQRKQAQGAQAPGQPGAAGQAAGLLQALSLGGGLGNGTTTSQPTPTGPG